MTAIATIFGIVTGVFWLLPNVSVAETAPLNPYDPFSTPFLVTNTGNLGISRIGVSCVFNNILFDNGNTIGTTVDLVRTQLTDMDAGDHDTVACKEDSFTHFSTPARFADISLVVVFYPSLAPWIEKQKSFRFITARNSDGTLRWVPKLENPKTKNKLFP